MITNNNTPHRHGFASYCLAHTISILSATATKSGIIPFAHPGIVDVLQLLGHPFVALLLANAFVWYSLGIRRQVDRKTLQHITHQSLAPAGSIILLTGAGGVFKQMLIDTGTGNMLAQLLADAGLPAIVFGFLAAALVRIACKDPLRYS
ncbi:MAG: hypothetical protein R2795_15940 [Saprospiraceae bacterium]